MVNILIATNDMKIVKKLTNEILVDNYDVRIAKISTNEDETINILNNANIYTIFNHF